MNHLVEQPLIDADKENGLFPGAVKRLREHVAEAIAAKQRLLENCEADILGAAQLITDAIRNGGKLLLCGNGGSAADCQHIAAELVSVLTQDYFRQGLPAMALTTDSSILTAIGNDFGFETVFERQVQALGRTGDVVMGISTSGNSENVVRAMRYANLHGMTAIALTGQGGGKMLEQAAICVRVPSPVVMHVQESHIMVGHILCALVERAIAHQ